MLGSSFALSMQTAQDLTSPISASWSSEIKPDKDDNQATQEMLALLEVWPYVDRPQPEHFRFTKENISRLIAKGADLNVKTKAGKTPLIKAVGDNNVEIVHLLINAGAHIDEKKAPIVLAAIMNSTKMVDELIKLGANVNQQDETGKTPLYVAVWHSNPAMIKLLLNAGADIDKTSAGITPLMQAVITKNPNIVGLLLQEGADRAINDSDGMTALDMAKGINNSEIIDLINNRKIE